MNNQHSEHHRYQLESPKLTGHRQQKTTCPSCGRKKCFVRYVDTESGCHYLDNSCGRCDHENSCGYHYKPAQLLHDQPWRKDSRSPLTAPPEQPRRKTPSGTVVYTLPQEYVTKRHSMQSTFWQWFSKLAAPRLTLSDNVVRKVFDDYLLGATRWGDVIFWQIDKEGRLRTGHIMHYDSNGHRQGYQGWVHARLVRQKRLTEQFRLRQCLFGEHLLARTPDAHVCIVESEKTALLLAACQPQYLWLATAGSGGLSPEKLACLRGRRVTVFPDSGCYEKWNSQMQHTVDIDYNVSDCLEGYPPNTDLADLLLDGCSPKTM